MAAIPEVARAGEARGGRGDVDKAVTLEAEHQGVDELEAGGAEGLLDRRELRREDPGQHQRTAGLPLASVLQVK